MHMQATESCKPGIILSPAHLGSKGWHAAIPCPLSQCFRIHQALMRCSILMQMLHTYDRVIKQFPLRRAQGSAAALAVQASRVHIPCAGSSRPR